MGGQIRGNWGIVRVEPCHRRRIAQPGNRCAALLLSAIPTLWSTTDVSGVTYSWNAFSGSWSTPGALTPPGPPAAGANGAQIVHNDGNSRSIIFDFNYPTTPLSSFVINQSGAGASTLTIATNRFAAGSETIGSTGKGI